MTPEKLEIPKGLVISEMLKEIAKKQVDNGQMVNQRPRMLLYLRGLRKVWRKASPLGKERTHFKIPSGGSMNHIEGPLLFLALALALILAFIHLFT